MAGAVGIARRAAAAGFDRDRRRRRPSLADADGGPAAGRGGRCGRAVPMRRECAIARRPVMWRTMRLAAVVGTFALTDQVGTGSATWWARVCQAAWLLGGAGDTKNTGHR